MEWIVAILICLQQSPLDVTCLAERYQTEGSNEGFQNVPPGFLLRRIERKYRSPAHGRTPPIEPSDSGWVRWEVIFIPTINGFDVLTYDIQPIFERKVQD